MNFSQLRRAFWLRRLSDASQSHLTLLKNHHRLGWLPETASRNDRGAALLIASNLENSLRIAIEGRGSIVSTTGLQASQEIAIIQSEVHLGNTGSNWYR